MITLIGADKASKNFIFPGGELHLNTEEALAHADYSESGEYDIRADLHSANDIMELLLFVNAIRAAKPRIKLHLLLPYLPYARQDRIANRGEPLSIKVMCDLINYCNFEEVEVWDCHSDVGLALLDNVVHVPVWDILDDFIPLHLPGSVLVSPDAGASKKTMKIAQKYNLGILQASKVRDTKTGNITGTTVDFPHYEKVDKDFIVVDDICDGGRTFLELQKVLRPLTSGKLTLFVTHGIFSNGVKLFDGLYDEVYTANPWPEVPTKRVADNLYKLNLNGDL